jgi:orotate phosphoribosyltransferase
MKPKITFIEPLLLKLADMIKDGQKDCLDKSLTYFGSQDDVQTLAKHVESTYKNDGSLIAVDFTPFVSLGNPIRMRALGGLYARIPFLVVARKGIAYEQLQALSNISILVCEEKTADIVDFYFSGKWKLQLERAAKKSGLMKGKSFLEVHRKWADESLLDLIPGSIRKPPHGIRYLPLHDGAWANAWIDVKKIVSNPTAAFFIAYQMGYLLTSGYAEDFVEDGIVVGNNTALILAVFLNAIFDKKELVILDRLGPYPNLSELRFMRLERVEGKQLCMVEDVISTARELDMTQLIMFLNKAEVKKAICLFDLEIASSRFIDRDNILSLCKPSTRISYRRIPRYMYSDQTETS